jgi:hypothetical protein
MVLVFVPYSVRLQFSKLGATLMLFSKNCNLIGNGMYTVTKKGGRETKVTIAGNVVPIPLRDGRTLMLPMQENFWGAIEDIMVQLRVCVPLGNASNDLHLSTLHGLGHTSK